MATIKLTITVDKLSNVLTLFDVIKVYRSTTIDGTYSEITGVGTRVALVVGQSVYTYDDTSGDPTYYYKTSYYHETSTLESSLSDPILGSSNALYLETTDFAEESLDSSVTDTMLLDRILVWQRFIERATGNFFIPREMQFELDGNGTMLLQMPIPIISVSSITIDDDEVDTDLYVVYNGRGETGRDDRKNPRIKMISSETSIFTGVGNFQNRSNVFTVGEKNVVVDGVFGFVEADGSIPSPIKYAIKKMVVKSSTPMGDSVNSPAGPLTEERT